MTNFDDITLPPVECTRCGKHAPDPSSKEADAWEMQIATLDGVTGENLSEDNSMTVLWCPQCAATPIGPEQEIAAAALKTRARYATMAPQRKGDLSGDSLVDDLIRLHMQGDKLDATMMAILAEQLQQDLRVVWAMDYEGSHPQFARQMFLTEAKIIAAILADTK